MTARASRPRLRLLAVLAAGVCATTVLGTAAAAAPARPHTLTRTAAAERLAAVRTQARAEHGTVRWAVDARPGCATAGQAHCFTVVRRAATSHTPHAYPYVQPAVAASSPAGTYSPATLASTYGFDPTVARSTTTVGIIGAYDDPNALADLNAFDQYWNYPAETSSTFRKVNQNGGPTMPPASHTTAVQTALDVQAVRAVCHTCRILLVEASSNSDANLAAAVNRAVLLGASIVSTAYGTREGASTLTSSVVAAYNHPGVVITAPTGDNGWYGWDVSNNGLVDTPSTNAPNFPSTYPNVVSVGGTTLTTNTDGTRNLETVWNTDGRENDASEAEYDGATGGGCSKTYSARNFQTKQTGYSATGCAGKRLAADVAALADPTPGFGVYDTYGTTGGTGWKAGGGTSLSAALIAGMYGLAGGAKGSAYPAAALYVNNQLAPGNTYDVTPQSDDADVERASGNGYCGGVAAQTCGQDLYDSFGKYSPNALYFENGDGAWEGLLDCSFPRTPTNRISRSTSSECNSTAGYDGPSGLGTPAAGALFNSPIFRLSYTAPTSGKVNQTLAFTAAATPTVAGQSVHQFTYSWGDGSATAYLTYGATHHTFRKAGTFTVTLGVTDNYDQVVISRKVVKIT